MASLCSAVCDSQQKDDRLGFFFPFFLCICVFIPSHAPSAPHKGALSLLARCADGDMMARRHSRVNIIRESLFSKLSQPEMKKLKRQENTRRNMAKFYADEILRVFQRRSEAKIPDKL